MMQISAEIVVTVLLALFGFIFGALWGHHGAIARRVTYADCSQKRHECPCHKEIEELKGEKKK
ncbi:hypothetical protein HF882_17890 [Victivallis vadensis]|uniref:Uncharacterized protein n=1 Tax=Victivallis vadensis TaxID=172901 RepID=A0A848B5Z4_9BACT|nr:hypothetical protein [Victivallis vadensis]NMD88462.1 hypothetical protein [Victivallis vadensis]